MLKNKRNIIKLILLGAIVIAVTGACQPVPGTVFIAGDSLTVQTAITADALPQGWDVVSGLGWQAENVQPLLEQRVNDPARSPETVVIALGQNDAGGGTDGFSSADQLQVVALARTPDPAAKVAWVLPWSPGHATRVAGLNAYRSWVITFAQSRGECVVDWMPLAQAHPEYLDPDMVHLTEAGRLAYGQLLQDAVACAK